MKRHFGLVGLALTHSYSKQYFTQKFKSLNLSECTYTLYPISDISKIRNIVDSDPYMEGLNVTTPYKELVFAYLDEFDEPTMKYGTINTIKVVNGDGQRRLKGYNTDIYGLRKLFDGLSLPANSKAIILGGGGSGKTVKAFLNERNIPTVNISRNATHFGSLAYADVNENLIRKHNIIVNATPVGMYPQIDTFPNIPYQYIGSGHICVDLVYNPQNTVFLQKCAQQGAKTANGLTMLYEQADKAWQIWNE